MSRYDGLIIPRSYSEYINKTDAATLSQALQLSGVLDAAPTVNSNKAVKSGGVKKSLDNLMKKESLSFSNEVTALEFSITNGFIHIFYSATYGGVRLYLIVIPQYNTITILNQANSGFTVTDITDNTNMKIRIERQAWNTYPCPVRHITY